MRRGQRGGAGGREQGLLAQPADTGGARQLGAEDGAKGRAARGEDGGGEPVERGAVGLGQRGAGRGGGRRNGT